MHPKNSNTEKIESIDAINNGKKKRITYEIVSLNGKNEIFFTKQIKIYDQKKICYQIKITNCEIEYYLNLLNNDYVEIYYCDNLIFLSEKDYKNKINGLDKYDDESLCVIEKEINILENSIKLLKNLSKDDTCNFYKKNISKEELDKNMNKNLEKLEQLSFKKNKLEEKYPTNIFVGESRCIVLCKNHLIKKKYRWICIPYIKCIICREEWRCKNCLLLLKNHNLGKVICHDCNRNVDNYNQIIR